MDEQVNHAPEQPDFTLLFEKVEADNQSELLQIVRKVAEEADPISNLAKIIEEMNAPVVQTFYSAR
jgi:hypothetical protein